MTEIVSVRFKDAGKVYYFDPNGLKVRIGDNVIVETARGVECATVAAATDLWRMIRLFLRLNRF